MISPHVVAVSAQYPMVTWAGNRKWRSAKIPIPVRNVIRKGQKSLLDINSAKYNHRLSHCQAWTSQADCSRGLQFRDGDPAPDCRIGATA
jgi:hypothetical protein